jgi:hypothetical protein
MHHRHDRTLGSEHRDFVLRRPDMIHYNHAVPQL